MRIVIAGGHGQIALRLERRLSSRGDQVAGLIRQSSQAADLRSAGAEPLLCDLESATTEQVARLLEGADAAVFAAGAGPGSGSARKQTVDYGAAVLFADAAEAAGVRRFLTVSTMGATGSPPDGIDAVFAAYLRAKGAAERDLQARTGLDWTVVRPGRLTNRPGTGRVRLEEHADRGEISRDDVAAVLETLLDTPATKGLTLELVSGDTQVAQAVRAVAAAHRR